MKVSFSVFNPLNPIICLLFSFSAFAAPIGNPAAPSILQQGLFIPDTVWCQPRVSFLGDFTTRSELSCVASPNPVHQTFRSGSLQLASATWSIQERFDASLYLGSSNTTFRIYQDNQITESQLSGGLVWYGEGKLVLIEMKDTVLSIFGEGGGWDWMSGPSYINDFPLAHQAHLKMRFWEAGASIMQRIGFFSPYLGIAAMQSRWKISTLHQSPFRFKQEYETGPFVGCTLSNGSKMSLNIEWRGWFENSLSASGELRF